MPRPYTTCTVFANACVKFSSQNQQREDDNSHRPLSRRARKRAAAWRAAWGWPFKRLCTLDLSQAERRGPQFYPTDPSFQNPEPYPTDDNLQDPNIYPADTRLQDPTQPPRDPHSPLPPIDQRERVRRCPLMFREQKPACCPSKLSQNPSQHAGN